eukprot:TRINITY_DN4365_c0_g1_i6.p1 TRINITY_DN4365_c0_g1~~TRINITY_DN4365_c0_g1_i6.p1  ORF type:complete len:100 (+),score=6.85 TRINITY_DN4365_c0_g1_i6:24-323(+)
MGNICISREDDPYEKNEPLSLRSVKNEPLSLRSVLDMSPLSPDPMVRLPPRAPHEMRDEDLRQNIYVPLSARKLQNLQREQALSQQYHQPLPEERARCE